MYRLIEGCMSGLGVVVCVVGGLCVWVGIMRCIISRLGPTRRRGGLGVGEGGGHSKGIILVSGFFYNFPV